MATEQDTPMDRLWQEYAVVFRDFDDLTLARWMAQTLGQLKGRVWRLSHPLVGAYRLAAQTGTDRQIWLKRLVSTPADYVEAACCRAPLLPLFTRDIVESGLVCEHCGGTAVEFADLDPAFQQALRQWSDRYALIHQVAHWDEKQKKRTRDYDRDIDDAAVKAEDLLAEAARNLIPKLLDFYPTIIWEDHDECLDVRPEDIDS
ncbi:MAG: hypothetical protein HZA90_23780 [Verrucomicrobia bacterium]|nr:hypothetical protein [Verrucomicrobiota bacterium]